METENEFDQDDNQTRFPLDDKDRPEIAEIIETIRNRLMRMSPADLRCAASALLALKHLPLSTRGIDVTFGFREPNFGEYAWADIAISEECFALKIGERVAGDMGGDTETRTVFAAVAGNDKCYGSIREWLDDASMIVDGSILSCEDRSDHESVDWYADEVDGWEAS